MRIELWRKDGTFAYQQISSAPVSGTGSYNWTIPENLPVETGWRVKIINTGDETVFDFSEEFRTIAGPYISVISPTTGDDWHMGVSYTIQWDDNVDENVRISLLLGGTFYLDIIENTESDGIYDWAIPTNGNIQAGTDYTISISSVDNIDLYDTGNTFEISESSAISITAPTAGVNWQMGSTQSITWTDNITENVNIELFKAGVKVTTGGDIALSIASDGSYEWLIPTSLTAGTDYTIRITWVINSGTTAESSQFTISNETGTVTDYDANTYQTVKIGNQWWMAENLKVTSYSNGTVIPLVTDNTEWGNLVSNITAKAYYYYNNDAGTSYGALYTWAATMNGASSSSTNPSGVQGICPTGWHIPSDAEWSELTEYLTNNGYGHGGSGSDIAK